jgi:hypothetical protein
MVYYYFFAIIGILIFINSHLVAKNYTPYLVSYIINDGSHWNPNSDRLKLTLIITFLIAPIVLFRMLLNYNSESQTFNSICLSGIILIMIYSVLMIKKVIKSDFNALSKENITNKNDKFINRVKEDIVIIKDNQNKFEFTFVNLLNKITNTQKGIKTEVQNIKNEILEIKKTTQSKRRESQKREDRINKISDKFEIFKKDLLLFSKYNAEKKLIVLDNYDITELQGYQILLIFFQRQYNIPKDKTRNIIYDLFNAYFSISLENGMHANNWGHFKDNHLGDIRNQKLYSDLLTQVKISTQQLNELSK